jgi:oxygen-independent coproporphyrinogen-3 oxidase
LIEEAMLPDAASRHAQADAIATSLAEAGYRRIGLDHYALATDALARAQSAGTLRRNFQGYTTDPSDILIGFGASAIGRLAQGYVQNEVALGRYAARISRGKLATAKGYALTPNDRLRADLIERVMCDFEVDIGEVRNRHGAAADALRDVFPRLSALEEDGVIRFDGNLVSVSEGARLLVRAVAAAFDAHLGSSGRLHSRAV